MTDKQLKILKRNLNTDGLTNLVQLKYDNNKLRIVAPVEVTKDSVIVVQVRGYSESGLSKSRDAEKKRTENLRTFEFDKVKTVRELSPTRKI